MRKFVGRTAATAALAAVAILPLAGAASAAAPETSAKPSASDRCWHHHGERHCYDGRWHDDNDGLLDLDLGLGLL
ncbi:hypothetical protein ACIQM4_33470 [Streptomyces sp. NPDC091272]|uniref:hypothetical protein n=1 Tax=Streptomyces sp. NPDC091272 TaxID=3365981 RepID=UPI0038240C64